MDETVPKHPREDERNEESKESPIPDPEEEDTNAEDVPLVGTLTDRDIAIRVVAEGKDPASTSVREVASTDVVTVSLEQDLDEALSLMAQHQVRRVPVVEEDGRLVGVVAQADVARQADEHQTGELVGHISKESS